MLVDNVMDYDTLTRTRLRRLLLVVLVLFASATTRALARLAEARVAFSAPNASTTWQAGAVHEVAWRPVPGLLDSPGDDVQVQLLNNGQFVLMIGRKVDVVRGRLVWWIPANVVSSRAYQLRIGNDDSDWAYSARFAIKAVDGVVKAMPAVIRSRALLTPERPSGWLKNHLRLRRP
ncbi:hypothetical protein [Streptomyces sp. AK02-04a]|uniref:hypothetical protein n=1 Tax=Streptomyces sp. AK02-04a TaxID=3028649 RepID=UPI0029B8FFA8|nr:hypothetical protein [Streptomyces sp. AK02-04a]MDX3763770.1 Ser-Thr-rich GPI-anchored membrane family protein [Streptomyces sp. AK02-04a]